MHQLSENNANGCSNSRATHPTQVLSFQMQMYHGPQGWGLWCGSDTTPMKTVIMRILKICQPDRTNLKHLSNTTTYDRKCGVYYLQLIQVNQGSP
jgi:hypothetical protein